MAVFNSLEGYLDLELALVVVPLEIELFQQSTSECRPNLHSFHETAHAETIFGTEYYSKYAQSHICKGAAWANRNLVTNQIRAVVEAVPSAIRILGDELHSPGTATNTTDGKDTVSRLLAAARKYYTFLQLSSPLSQISPIYQEAGVTEVQLRKRAAVIGIARAVLDLTALNVHEGKESPNPINLIDEFTSNLDQVYSEDLIPRPSDSIYSHISRVMQNSALQVRMLDKSGLLKLVLESGLEKVLEKPQLLAGVIGLNLYIKSYPILRIANFFNSNFSGSREAAEAKERWILQFTLFRSPILQETQTARKAFCPVERSFNPLIVNGIMIRVYLPESQDNWERLSGVMTYLQMRQYFHRLPKLLSFILGDSNAQFEPLERVSDQLTAQYLKRVEGEVSQHRKREPQMHFWKPKDYKLKPRIDRGLGYHLEVETA